MNTNIESRIESTVVLAPFTTLGVGGPARYFLQANIETEIIAGLEFASTQKLPVFVLGGGSNVLISDSGFDGLVIHIRMDRTGDRFKTDELEASRVGGWSRRITAGAGENWDDFVQFCVENHLAGVECLSGIPGTVGGTPVQNVGAYGQDVSETIDSVGCIDRETFRSVRFTNRECGFSYRKSIFNSYFIDRYIVYDVTYELIVGGKPKIAYTDLSEFFGSRVPDLGEMREAVIGIRQAKSMVIDANDPNSKSVGSFFKNPILSDRQFNKLRSEYPGVPGFVVANGQFKIPAAWLIENAGFVKGFRIGNAGISTKHSLAIINYGNASAAEIIDLAKAIQNEVKRRFDIELAPEPVFIGF